jgi:hypothetical protein
MGDAMPRIGGMTGLQEPVKVVVDAGTDHEVEVPVRYHGADGRIWEADLPELADGDHTITYGNPSRPTTTLPFNVEADDAAREAARQRNQQWREGGAEAWADSQRQTPGSPVTPEGSHSWESDALDARWQEYEDYKASPIGQANLRDSYREVAALEMGVEPTDPDFVRRMEAAEALATSLGINPNDPIYGDFIDKALKAQPPASGSGGGGGAEKLQGADEKKLVPPEPLPGGQAPGAGAPPPPAGGQGAGGMPWNQTGQQGQGGGGQQGGQGGGGQQGGQGGAARLVLGIEKGNEDEEEPVEDGSRLPSLEDMRAGSPQA